MAYKGINKLKKSIRVQKDELPTLSHFNVVYRLNYKDCNASYVRQTGRILKTRIKEHKPHQLGHDTTFS